MKSAISLLAVVFSLATIAAVVQAQPQPRARQVPTENKSEAHVARPFQDVLSEVKAKTRLPILLPSELPKSFANAKHAVVNEASPKKYSISLYFELDIGDAGFAAMFSGEGNPGYHAWELPNTSEVKLAHSVRGYFLAVSCGGSCSPANLWWEDGGVLYQIQLRLPSSMDEKDQEKTLTLVASSAILAGPR
jgi:hypothetical protein